MRKLFEFIRSVYVAVLFVMLEAAAIHFYAHSTAYTQARLLTRSSRLAGDAHSLIGGVGRYFSLASENRRLVERVAALEERLAAYSEAEKAQLLDSYLEGEQDAKYRMTTASVVAGSVNRTQNLLTLNRGFRDGVTVGMGVLSATGAMVGYVVDCSERYAVAMPVLNTQFRSSGRLAGTDYFGSISWDGRDAGRVQLTDISKYAEPAAGQEVVTTGFSQYFPEDVLIGWVEDAELNETNTAYTVSVRLAAEVSRLRDVVLVGNRDREEVGDLQEQVRQNGGVIAPDRNGNNN
ncbi:rod shape-determining protein MreC [uncultured Alistipes sp.]|uniref:rod shape-determining protein MreC n=1 Tax=uncultured Alistipes sp. TaxID=538949 RepID=UPI002633CBDE|nr:rod shape-determining protein MreC [uncultured Alistipes sp.]